MALWMLIPDKLDDDDVPKASHFGVFGTTRVAFFLAEMGDKTQIATVMLAARYVDAYVWVVLGTTLGMMLANAPVVWLGERIVQARADQAGARHLRRDLPGARRRCVDRLGLTGIYFAARADLLQLAGA